MAATLESETDTFDAQIAELRKSLASWSLTQTLLPQKSLAMINAHRKEVKKIQKVIESLEADVDEEKKLNDTPENFALDTFAKTYSSPKNSKQKSSDDQQEEFMTEETFSVHTENDVQVIESVSEEIASHCIAELQSESQEKSLEANLHSIDSVKSTKRGKKVKAVAKNLLGAVKSKSIKWKPGSRSGTPINFPVVEIDNEENQFANSNSENEEELITDDEELITESYDSSAKIDTFTCISSETGGDATKDSSGSEGTDRSTIATRDSSIATDPSATTPLGILIQ